MIMTVMTIQDEEEEEMIIVIIIMMTKTIRLVMTMMRTRTLVMTRIKMIKRSFRCGAVAVLLLVFVTAVGRR